MGNQTTDLDGSVDMLAKAMRNVFVDAMEKTGRDLRTDIKSDMDAMEGRLNKRIDQTNGRIDQTNERIDQTNERLDQRLDTTNKNMQSQFAQQEKAIAEISRKLD